VIRGLPNALAHHLGNARAPRPRRRRFHLRDAGYTTAMRLLRINLLGLIYLVAGVLVAATHHYFRNLHSLRLIASAVLAIVLWPLVLLGVDLHIHP
jgi:hypothetical protein